MRIAQTAQVGQRYKVAVIILAVYLTRILGLESPERLGKNVVIVEIQWTFVLLSRPASHVLPKADVIYILLAEI